MYMNHFKSFCKWIPGRIIDKLSRTLYRIEINDNVRIVHVSSIRKSKLSDKYLPNVSTSSQVETRLPKENLQFFISVRKTKRGEV